MDIEMIALRLIHVGLGVFWAGTMFFLALYLGPSVRAAGPAGAQVILRLGERGIHKVLPLIGGLTILSGLRLFWRLSGGFNHAWLRSGTGLCYSGGAVAALAAFAVGVLVTRPAVQRLATVTDPAQAQALFGRLSLGSRWTAVLLAVTVTLMAVGRYV